MDNTIKSKPTQKVVIRSVALPSEHGGWGFLIEPIILGLLVAPSWEGLLLVLAGFGIFLIHQPLKIATKDRLKGRRPPRLVWAERFVIIYGLLAAVPIVVLMLTTPLTFLLPIVLAVPFAGIQLYYDARNQSRHLVPEISGALALAMIAPAIVILGGWETLAAMVLWLILALRVITSIPYIRARLRLEHNNPTPPQPVWLLHGVVLLIVIGLAAASVVPWLAVVPFIVLLLRAVIGLSHYRKPRSAKVIGFQELGYGLMTVLLVGVGYVL